MRRPGPDSPAPSLRRLLALAVLRAAIMTAAFAIPAWLAAHHGTGCPPPTGAVFAVCR